MGIEAFSTHIAIPCPPEVWFRFGGDSEPDVASLRLSYRSWYVQFLNGNEGNMDLTLEQGVELLEDR